MLPQVAFTLSSLSFSQVRDYVLRAALLNVCSCHSSRTARYLQKQRMQHYASRMRISGSNKRGTPKAAADAKLMPPLMIISLSACNWLFDAIAIAIKIAIEIAIESMFCYNGA